MDPDMLDAVVAAVSAGAVAGAKDTATAAVKDAYAGLKQLLVRRQLDLRSLERRPESTAKRDSLREDLSELEGTSDAVDAEVVTAARQVVDAVAEHDAAAAAAVGVDLSRVRADFVRIQNVDSAGTGARLTDVDVAGGISITDVRVGGTAPSVPGRAPDPSER